MVFMWSGTSTWFPFPLSVKLQMVVKVAIVTGVLEHKWRASSLRVASKS